VTMFGHVVLPVSLSVNCSNPQFRRRYNEENFFARDNLLTV